MTDEEWDILRSAILDFLSDHPEDETFDTRDFADTNATYDEAGVATAIQEHTQAAPMPGTQLVFDRADIEAKVAQWAAASTVTKPERTEDTTVVTLVLPEGNFVRTTCPSCDQPIWRPQENTLYCSLCNTSFDTPVASEKVSWDSQEAQWKIDSRRTP